MTSEQLNRQLQQTLERGRVRMTRPAGCPAIVLYLFDPSVLEGPLSHDEAQAVVAEPAYWSFCWASGQALAGWILAHPERVTGRTVLDFGCGSGVVAIAAALAGAREVIACDLAPAALLASEANARLNGVRLTPCNRWNLRPSGLDVVVAADVLYDRDNMPLLNEFCEAAPTVLLADSRVADPGDDRYCLQTVVEARTWPDLNEFEEFNRVRIYQAKKQ
ncbi:class I SAM-dependent methyltransferase [Marinobacter sp.]|uniref:class I SAM-dependent methyltransferase n=1 Tax=Marinobacter sp. TaxID=50741 RepID=UPI00384FD9E5